MTDLLLNSRFLMRPPTGVDRVATELADALISLAGDTMPVRGLRPAGEIVQPESRPEALLTRVEASSSRLKGHAWEQIALAGADPGAWLLSLCNMGPALRRRQVVMMHDAQVFRQPESYSRAFRSWYHLVQPRLARRAELVLTVSEHSRRELEHFGVVPPGKARVVPNGADHILRIGADRDILGKHGLEPGGYFLAIGSLAPHKNLALIAEAALKRSDRSRPLVIAGGGNASVFSDSGIVPSDDVRVIGRVSDAELRGLYDNATALVFPSLTEGFGLPPAEAMFCGCPVIATTGGAVPEVCGEAALSLPPSDASAWAAAMDRISTDDGLRRNLAEAGAARVARFTWENAAKTLMGHLQDLTR